MGLSRVGGGRWGGKGQVWGGDRGQHRGFCGMRIGERVWLYFEGRADWIF